MTKRSFMENRHFYYLRVRQYVLGFVGIVGFFAILHRDFSAFDVPKFLPVVIAGCLLAFCLWRVFAAELRWMRSHRLFLFPSGQGTLKKWGQSAAARWASLWELNAKRWRPGDIVIGRPLPEQSFFGIFRNLLVGDSDKRHVLTISLNGGGKTSCAVIPNLLTYPGSAIVMDPKGELAYTTAARRGHGDERVTRGLGQDVHIVDPFQTVKGARRACFNPLAELDPYNPRVTEDVQVVVDALIPQEDGGGNEKYFRDRGRALLKATILHAISVEPADRHTLPFVRTLLMKGDEEAMREANEASIRHGDPPSFDDPLEALFEFMAANPSYNGMIANEAASIVRTAPDERSGILGVINQSLDFIGDREVHLFLSRSDFALSDIKRKDTTVYLCLPALRMAGPYIKILTLFIALAGEMMEREKVKPKHPVLFMFDEMAAFGYMKTIEKSFGLMRGMGMKIWAVVQDISQIQKDYPTIWRNISANVGALQILGVREIETARYVSEALPKVRINQPGGGVDERPLLSADEILTEFSDPDARRQIYLPVGKPPAILEAVPYFELFDKSMFHEWNG